MTEPSAEARQLAERYTGRWWEIRDMACEIDTLTEQRVAAAVQAERERCAGIAHRRRPAVAGWAHDATVAIEREIRAADRPAPAADSSPTQTVASPGPTAGDVERARTVMNEADHQIETWKEVPGAVVGRSTYIDTIAAALSAERASTRAELLAQIRDPSDELSGPLKDKYWQFGRDELTEFLRALADKLTEAK